MLEHLGGKKMIKNYLMKRLLISSVIFLLIFSSIPITMSKISNSNDKKLVTIKVYDCNQNNIVKTEKEIPIEQFKIFVSEIMQTEINEKSFYDQLIGKVNILKNYNLISQDSQSRLIKVYEVRKNILNNRYTLPSTGIIFDVANIFNGLFFGVKGEKERSILELNLAQFPFLNGTASAQFCLIHKIVGDGTVFSLGFLGFKYNYGYNETEYPEFPHFPSISGGVVGFTGILVDVDVDHEDFQGHYVFGIGMSFLTMWNLT